MPPSPGLAVRAQRRRTEAGRTLWVAGEFDDGAASELCLSTTSSNFTADSLHIRIWCVREVREHTGLGNTQLKVHLRRLEELEYLLVHAGGRGQSLVYELVYEGGVEAGAPLLPGLIDVERLGEHGRYSYRCPTCQPA
ncbi:MAG: hypothetical protein ACOC9I_01570 [Actinomycetota bacterium]